MYETILVPTAGDAGTERAMAYAIEEARTHGASLQLLAVTDPETAVNAGFSGAFSTAEWEAEARALAEDAIEQAESHVPDDVAAETFIKGGIPKEAIVDHIEDENVDLVVMATHGRTGVRRVLIGSTTESVVRHSPAPVLTVRTDDTE